MPFTDLPLDILQPVLAHLSDRRDWHACTLVNKEFNKVATPLLYWKLDSRIKHTKLYHPSATIIKRPELAKYVKCVTETGAVHFKYRHLHPNITRDTLHALSLCTNLNSLTWTDDSASYVVFGTPFNSRTSSSSSSSSMSSSSPNPPLGFSRHHGTSTTYEQDAEHPLLSLLAVIKAVKAPLHELTIRSHGDLGSHVWSELSKWAGLSKIGIWCMEGPPRVLQGWAGQELGKTLTQLELGRCAGVPPTILISVISQLPRLQDLCLKGAPAAAVLTILTSLPSLLTLDTEYLDLGIGNIWPRGWALHVPTPVTNGVDGSPTMNTTGNLPLMPTLRNLTVRTSSIDTMGPNKLFPWIRALVCNPGLECFRLLSFTTSGYTTIPRGFILEMARVHGDITNSFDSWFPEQKIINRTDSERGLKKWIVGRAQMTLADIECVCKTFSELEELVCSVAVVMGDMESIMDAIASANNLRTLRLHVQWIPPQHQHQRHRTYSTGQLPSTSTTHPSSKPSDGLFSQATASPDPDSRLIDSDSELDSEAEYSDSVPNPNHFRFSGDAGGRGAFGFDEVGLRYATLNRYMQTHELNANSDPNSDSLIIGHGNGESSDGVDGVLAHTRARTMSRGYERPFTLEHARKMMLREGSKLRVVAVGGVVYTGKWVWDVQEGKRMFEVVDGAGELAISR